MTGKTLKWKNVETHFHGKKVKGIVSVTYDELEDIKNSLGVNVPKDIPFMGSLKQQQIAALKRLGVDLVYGTDFSKPVGYNTRNEKFQIENPKEFQLFINTISFDEWDEVLI